MKEKNYFFVVFLIVIISRRISTIAEVCIVYLPWGCAWWFSALSFILVLVFLCVILLIWSLPRFLHTFGPLCHPGYLEILYMWCCSSACTRISVSVRSFLNPVMDHMLLRVVILLVTF